MMCLMCRNNVINLKCECGIEYKREGDNIVIDYNSESTKKQMELLEEED